MPNNRSTAGTPRAHSEKSPADRRRPTISSGEPDIIFTGRRQDRRFKVFIRGKMILLTAELMRSLIELAAANVREAGGSGLVQLQRVTVYRLRQAIDKTVGPGTGAALIATGSGNEYYLAIPPKDWKERVALTPCFVELVRINVASSEAGEVLSRHCRLLDADEAEEILRSF